MARGAIKPAARINITAHPIEPSGRFDEWNRRMMNAATDASTILDKASGTAARKPAPTIAVAAALANPHAAIIGLHRRRGRRFNTAMSMEVGSQIYAKPLSKRVVRIEKTASAKYAMAICISFPNNLNKRMRD